MAPASLETLPNELLYKICHNLCPHCVHFRQCLKDKHTLLRDARTALSCVSRTSRRLREIAQPVLYHRVYTEKHWYFLRSIMARPDLAAYVRQLHCSSFQDGHPKDLGIPAAIPAYRRLLENRHQSYTRRHTIQPHVLEFILTRLPNAHELHINTDYLHGWEWMVESKAIRRLRLYGNSTLGLRYLGSVVSAMPSLEDLAISTQDSFSQRNPVYPLPISKLRTLDLEWSRWNPSDLTALMNQCPRLERFRCRGILSSHIDPYTVTWPQMQQVLEPLSKTLKHVNLSHWTSSRPDQRYLRDSLGSFRNLDGLETLWIDVGNALPKRWKPRIPRFPASTTELIELLPESLRLVHFRSLTRGWHGIEMLAHAIQGGHFPRLETVVVQQTGRTLTKSRRALAAVGVACESMSGAFGDGRHIFPQGGFWEECK